MVIISAISDNYAYSFTSNCNVSLTVIIMNGIRFAYHFEDYCLPEIVDLRNAKMSPRRNQR